jgi:hypothetical protein
MVFFKGGKSWMDAHGGQYSSGWFLILMYPEGRLEGEPLFNMYQIRGMPIYTKMSQLGQFMMASAKIKGHEIALSGAYGAMGLTKDVPREIYALATPCPLRLVEAWSKGGGWNSAGSELFGMCEWAKELLEVYSELGWWRQKYARFL